MTSSVPNTTLIEEGVKLILQGLGKDPNAEGLRDTPARVGRFYKEFILHRPPVALTTFSNEGMDEMVVVRDITFFSLCEHHMLPFVGRATIGYIPDKRVLGLSKLVRLVRMNAQDLQLQERLTNQIADAVVGACAPQGVGVVLKAQHLCMAMRGVCDTSHETITSCMRGVMLNDGSAKRELLDLADVHHA